jgi:hypothetical protein
MDRQRERRLLQAAIAIAYLVPLTAGTAGTTQGSAMLLGDIAGSRPDLESHFRYLSGLLLGIGIGFAATIPTIERRSELFTALSGLVVAGGLARLSALPIHGIPSAPHVVALGMELVAVPLLFAWQRRIARQFRPGVSHSPR